MSEPTYEEKWKAIGRVAIWIAGAVVFVLGGMVIAGCSNNLYPVSPISEEAARAAYESNMAEANECLRIPEETENRIVGGLRGHVPGEWMGRPGVLLVIDAVTLTAFEWPGNGFLVRVSAGFPDTAGGWAGHTSFMLLVEGSLENPEQVWYLSRGGTNPTAFDTIVRQDWPYHSSTFCHLVGAVSGPYRTDELGSH